MSYLQELHQARQARLARFAAAAFRHPTVKPVMSRYRQDPQPAEEPRPRARRSYQTARAFSPFTPMSQRVILLVAEEFEITPAELVGPSRGRPFTTARFVAVGILVELTTLSFPSIGRLLGGRDHTTMLHARDQARLLFASEAFRNRVDQIKAAAQNP